MSEYSNIAHKMIEMWNSSFSKTIRHREEAASLKINFVKSINSLNSTNRNSNKKLHIKEYKKPTANFTTFSRDGIKLVSSVWLNPKPSKKWVIGVHGFNSSRFDVLYLTWHYRTLGYNIITFDFRNHGSSATDVVTWGYKEKWDLMTIISWVTQNYKPEEIGLVGTSMGGFTINYFALTEEKFIEENNIKWAISDSAYMSVSKLLKGMVANNAPKIFENYVNVVLEDMLKIYKNEYLVDLVELDFINLIEAKHKYIPIMYIHNRFDRVTNFLDSFKMQDIKNNIEESNVNELIIYDSGMNHTKSIIKFTDDYIIRTSDFVKKHQI
ncbi:alpha/beta hydrolase [Mesoplasma chauliocola]|uniref:Alpha/beta hydrolase n=1 Tax=Mesoplasma chauliocola TaxID=216427 RepID=A0A249SNH5_9MOLU|nr:alpha/beta fold hydrolase [Mesoplasma chauliocola]ASZ09162.1 alpha/beta hydrolase [Mesoplasma chauliocola]